MKTHNAGHGDSEDSAWLRDDQRRALRDSFRVYARHRSSPDAGLAPADVEFLSLAIDGDWDAYRIALQRLGAERAAEGVGIREACAEGCAVARTLSPYLVTAYAGDRVRLSTAVSALIDFCSASAAIISQAYQEREVAAARAREQDLATTLDSIGDAVIVTDARGRVTRMNPVAERLTESSFADSADRPLEDILTIEAGSSGIALENPVARVLRHGAVAGLAPDAVLVTRDGTRLPIAGSGARIGQENGEVRGVVLVIRELTADRRAEEKHRYWQQSFERAPWGVAVASASDVRLQAVNPMYAKMHGYTVEALLGAPVSTLWAQETRADMERGARETHDHGRMVVETTHVRKDGSRLPVDVVATAIQDDEGKVVSFIAYVQDITERKRLQQSHVRAVELEAENRRLEEASRMKSEFLANMSHELRTPLNSIIGFAELLYDGQVGPVDAKQKEFLTEILTGGVHLLRLINDVLDLAKVEAGKIEFRAEPADLLLLVNTVIQNLGASAMSKNIELDVVVDPSLGDVVLDPGRFNQLVYNYVSNALKFTPDGGRVSVRVLTEAGDRFRVEVEDSGPGVPPDEASRLFVPFQQLGATAKRHAGTGLGLALTKQLAEAQGGTVEMRPAPGGGSIFCAVLPRYARIRSVPPEAAEGPSRATNAPV